MEEVDDRTKTTIDDEPPRTGIIRARLVESYYCCCYQPGDGHYLCDVACIKRTTLRRSTAVRLECSIVDALEELSSADSAVVEPAWRDDDDYRTFYSLMDC